jgi:hypothetical protein
MMIIIPTITATIILGGRCFALACCCCTPSGKKVTFKLLKSVFLGMF